MSVFLSLLPGLLPTVLAFLSPLLTAGVKKVVPKIPKVLVPLTSAAVGTVGAVAADYLTGSHLGAVGGAVAGAVGVFVREVVDQVQKSLSPEK